MTILSMRTCTIKMHTTEMDFKCFKSVSMQNSRNELNYKRDTLVIMIASNKFAEKGES